MPSSVPGFSELLGKCQRSAAHLEMRDSYAPTDRFEAWQRGERTNCADKGSWWHPYDQLISGTVARGVTIRRARIVSEPTTEYIRWEHYVTHVNVTAGEHVRWIPRRLATGIAPPENDFWLFDGTLLRVHHFSGDGAVAEDKITDDPPVAELCRSALENV
ncbi:MULTISPECIES: DUF6879 family protein [unclassified Streptomyces]|uniref:DUF6879 family protein n=1 Tax=unclassified Streptomyces TaxID=2593676 RepID=UPI0015877228|nr:MULTISPECIES: DUF6879 family protein [unclassified Streptomyces]NUV69874.1 hypothetical protein [Streptomyces sp. CAI-121]NUW03026.1 hypothetical protein [Streptomyces sp. CAI 127]NUW16354.1 hypothetical protein [Streptomyces sp. CAI-68]